MSNNLVKLQNISKSFGNKEVLININLEINSGEVVGIVGENGSGKTTILRIIASLNYPDQGNLYLFGKIFDVGARGKTPKKTGLLLETPEFMSELTGFMNLKLLASIENRISDKDIHQTMIFVGLDPKSKKKVKDYSLGMRQRLGIAQAIMEDQSIILFDEATNGLDQQGLEMFDQLIDTLRSQQKAIALVSHRTEEIKKYCDRVYRIVDKSLIEEN